MTLNAIAPTGGRGSIVGMVLGTALVVTINDILLLLRAPGFYFDMFIRSDHRLRRHHEPHDPATELSP